MNSAEKLEQGLVAHSVGESARSSSESSVSTSAPISSSKLTSDPKSDGFCLVEALHLSAMHCGTRGHKINASLSVYLIMKVNARTSSATGPNLRVRN